MSTQTAVSPTIELDVTLGEGETVEQAAVDLLRSAELEPYVVQFQTAVRHGVASVRFSGNVEHLVRIALVYDGLDAPTADDAANRLSNAGLLIG